MRRFTFSIAILFSLCLLVSTGCQGPDIKPDVPTSAAPPPISVDPLQDPNSIEAYMAIRSAGSPDVQADGVLYYMTWITGVEQLYRHTEQGPQAVTGEPFFPEGIDFYTISPSGAYAVVGADHGGDEQFDLYLVNLECDCELPVPIDMDRSVRVDSPLWMPDESAVIYRSTRRNGRDFDLWRYTLENNETTIFLEREGYNYPTDISADGKMLTFVRHMGGSLTDLFLLDIPSGAVRQLSPQGRTSGDYSGARFLADGRRILLTTDDGLEMGALAVMELENGTWKVLGEDKWPVDGVAVSPDRSRAAVIHNVHGTSRLTVLDTASWAVIAQPELPLGVISSAHFAEGAVYVTYSNAVKTGDIWRYVLDGGRFEPLTRSDYGPVDASSFRMPELVFYKSFDGREIPAYLYRPQGYDGRPAPYMIYAHGGPESQYRPGFIRNVQYNLSQGIGILAPNVRGSAGYTREYLNLDNYKKRMDSIKDFKAAADYLIEAGIADPARLGIYGGSYGGFVVMAAITEYPDLFAAAVNSVGIVNFVTFLQNTKGYRRAVRESEYGPLSDPEFLKSISPIFKIERVLTPLLIVHGENDPRVPVGEARQIVKALEARGQEVRAEIFADEGHGLSKLENRLVYYRILAEFLKKHLKPDPSVEGSGCSSDAASVDDMGVCSE